MLGRQRRGEQTEQEAAEGKLRSKEKEEDEVLHGTRLLIVDSGRPAGGYS